MPFADYDRKLLYDRWRAMIRRCTDPSHISYLRYGGRGITVDPKWMGPEGFHQWLDDMEEPPTPEHELDRIDNNGPYTKSNCRWVTSIEQGKNRRDNRNYTMWGETMTCADWSRDSRVFGLGLTEDILQKRHRAGWPAEQALTSPSDRNAVSPRRGSKAPEFAEQVRRIRELANEGRTQKEICRELGLRQAKVSKVLLGKIGRYVT